MNSPTTAAGWLVAHGIRATVFGLIVLTFDMHATAQSASPAQSALPVVFVGAGWGPLPTMHCLEWRSTSSQKTREFGSSKEVLPCVAAPRLWY